ncbi:dihydroxyacetone kinase subunit L [Brachyspira aalborgi]|uniref:Dihydroxyacetone kinase subunit L n=1 Tax=Brachyspira aalborgi TaxID=29522 RepID=A0A5C8G2L0_9SPIR|nr:dihydroxyacetone kinase subunit DhaL [Brachyspira aalborgi]TXJ56055.1 dihydroxyacetone kinase subunit L [Brachyspira aalborgi]
MSNIDIIKIKEWLSSVADTYEKNKDYLTQLDSDIGDADHGINMNRGFKLVKEMINSENKESISDIFKSTGTILIKNIGGSSGPLYGTFFLNAGILSNNKENLSLYDITDIFNKGANAISSLGKSKAGEKTMLDTLFPSLDAMKESINENSEDAELFKNKVMEAAENGMKSTINMLATKGRASYLGERSVGHQDPGATSMFMLIKDLLAIL